MTSLGMRQGPGVKFTSTAEAQNSQRKSKTKVLTCSYYNQGTCVHQKSHDTKGVRGGFESAPTQIFPSRYLYNSHFLSSESELHTDKNTAVHWFKNLKAFDQVVENKSYAQALSCNLNESKFKCREVHIKTIYIL